jgi:parallel beta-helix repeat protein
MAVPFELIVSEDLNLGRGSVDVTMPAGGSATGSKIGLHTFGLPIYNVKDFGAVGDAVNDDSSAIAAALAAAVAAGAGEIYFPPGTYKATQAFAITVGNIRLRGEGRRTSVIIWDDTAVKGFTFTGALPLSTTTLSADAARGTRDVVVTSTSNFVVGRWVFLFDSSSGLDGNGTFISRVFNISGSTITLEDALPFDLFTSAAAQINVYASTAWLEGISVRDLGFTTNATTAANKLTHLQLARCVSAQIDRCFFDNVASPLMTLVGCRDTQIVSNQFERAIGSSAAAVEVQTSTGTRMSLNTCRRCRFGLTFTNSPRTSVVGNILNGREPVSGLAGRGIRGGGQSNDSIILGNDVNDTGLYGIYLQSCSYCVVSGNSVFNVGWDDLEHGIQIGAGATHPEYMRYNVVSGNKVSKCTGYSIIVNADDSALAYPTYNIIASNMAEGSTHGQILLRSSFCSCLGNHVSSPTNAAQDIGGGAFTIQNQICGNHITRPGVTGSDLFAAISTSGSGGLNRVTGNQVSPAFLTFTGTDFPIAINTHATDTTDKNLVTPYLPLPGVFTHTAVSTPASTVETAAWTVTIPGGTLYNTTHGFVARGQIFIANNTNVKTIRVKFGTLTFAGVTNLAGGPYVITFHMEVFYTGVGAVAAFCQFLSDKISTVSGNEPGATGSNGSVDWTADADFTVTMQNGTASAGDAVFQFGKLTYEGVPAVAGSTP